MSAARRYRQKLRRAEMRDCQDQTRAQRERLGYQAGKPAGWGQPKRGDQEHGSDEG